MGYVQAQPRPAQVTDWVAIADFGGVGTADAASDFEVISFAGLPDLVEPPVIEVQFTQEKTAGAGAVSSWVRIPNGDTRSAGTSGTNAAQLYTHPSVGAGDAAPVSQARRVLIDLAQLRAATVGVHYGEDVEVRLMSKGTDATTEFTISGIQARLVYKPL